MVLKQLNSFGQSSMFERRSLATFRRGEVVRPFGRAIHKAPPTFGCSLPACVRVCTCVCLCFSEEAPAHNLAHRILRRAAQASRVDTEIDRCNTCPAFRLALPTRESDRLPLSYLVRLL